MKLLLDTNIFLAMLHENMSVLPIRIREVFDDGSESPLVSAVSFWEIGIKHRLGKLEIPVTLDRLPNWAARLSLGLLAITPDHAVADLSPSPATRDPFDRLLLAQCQVEGLKLLTTDRALSAHPLSAARV
jgi:PIN domain nuclease of toxin-antitoxin system